MNSLFNYCKSVPKVTFDIVRNGYFARQYAVLADYNIKWVRPEKIPSTKPEKSGDLGLDINIKADDIAPPYNKSKELEDADELVTRMFTLKFHPRKQWWLLRRQTIMNTVKRHESDWGSPEAHIANMTNEIHQLQEIIDKNPRCKVMKIFLKELIEKRKKYLKKLRTWDYRRFEWLLEKLNLIYKPVPAYEDIIGIHRKASLRKLTKKYCDKIIEDKLNAYKLELERQMIIFYQEKAEKLSFIRNEELSLGIEPSVTEEDIEQARKKSEKYAQQQQH